MARYWVAGATGFLGAHVVRCLRAEGHDVVGVSRGGGNVDGLVVDAIDVLDSARVAESARGADGAFLAMGKVSRDPSDAEELHRVNATGTRTALLGLEKAGVRRVVHASTSGTIAISTEPTVADETSETPLELIAKWPYYRTKRYGEMEALEANNPPDFEVVVVNPSLLLGPGDLRGSSTDDIRRFMSGEVLAVPRGGLAFVDVRDAALGMVSAMKLGRPGERYLLSAVNLSMPAFLQKLERITGVPGPRLPLPRSSALATSMTRLFERAVKAVGGELPMNDVSVEMAQHFWYCDSGKAMEELGFAPRDVATTLRDTVIDLVTRGVVHPREGHFGESAGTASPASFDGSP